MKICAAQTRPVKGDIQGNIEDHKRLINLAVLNGAEVVIFPELSLTGYEPGLARELATQPDDSRLDDFQRISDARRLSIGVGIPIKSDRGICISMVIFQPHRARHTYSKGYLHPDEDEFFVPGYSSSLLKVNGTNIALAICYEISVPQHLAASLEEKPEVYFASVAKFVSGIDKAFERLSEIAREHSLTVLMANSVGSSDGNKCAGKSSVWNSEGLLVGQLDDADEGVLVFDTDTQELTKETA